MPLALTYEREIILGIVPIPSKDQLWIYFQGRGTWYETRNTEETIIMPTPSTDISDLTILTSKSHITPEFQALLEKLRPKKVIGLGSVGFKIVSLLSGEADLYISYSSLNGSCPRDWDMAAPFALMKGAGGYFTDINSRDLSFLKDDNFEQRGILVASTNRDHQKICRKISELVNN